MVSVDGIWCVLIVFITMVYCYTVAADTVAMCVIMAPVDGVLTQTVGIVATQLLLCVPTIVMMLCVPTIVLQPAAAADADT